ncbi:hypothetical protein LTR56_026570, partial [Elasticomyces elasticus]
MRLLQCDEDGGFHLTEDLAEDNLPHYAILSHRWLAATDEPTFEDLSNNCAQEKLGYQKLRFCTEQARRDKLQHFWVDTCCINKVNKAEVSRSINSMFRWYQSAATCYVYLSDVSSQSSDSAKRSNLQSRAWFTRGWTLQELLAPRSVVFYSADGERLGDKRELEQHIHEVTAIPQAALRGRPLHRFSVDERLARMTVRETTLEEDKAYSLAGLFDISLAHVYGEGFAQAHKRLLKLLDKRGACVRDLHLSNPYDDKKRIEHTKGGLLVDSYDWILGHSQYVQWRESGHRRMLWIKGDPGKGKTMLLCGIINELKNQLAERDVLSYFFCQASDSRINNATAVLRGLVLLLVDQQPSLTSQIRSEYDRSGKKLFEDENSWFALSDIFTRMLQDASFRRAYLIIDALDECVEEVDRLLDFIGQTTRVSTKMWKHICSSDNEDLCKSLLSTTTVLYRPATLAELTCITESLTDASHDSAAIISMIELCGSFLTVREDRVYFVHESAREFLSQTVSSELYPFGKERVHYDIFSRSLQHLSMTLKRDIYSLSAPDINIEDVTRPEVDPLAKSRYSTVYWIAHLRAWYFGLSDDPRSGSSHCNIHVKPAVDEDWSACLQTLEGHSSSVDSVVFSADSSRLASASGDKTVKIWDASSGQCLRTLEGHSYWVISVVFSADSSRLASASDDKTVKTWDASSGQCLRTLEGHSSYVSSVVFSTDSSRLASASYDKTVKIWDASSGQCLRTLEGHSDSVTSVVFSADSSRLASASYDKTVKIWDASSGQCLRTLGGHSDRVSSVVFSADSSRLASVSWDMTVKIWDASSGQCLQTLE